MFDYKICKFWLGWLGIIFFITACGPVTAVPEVKPTLVFTPPPDTLEVDGVTQMAGIGSYCWSSGGCAGYFAHPPEKRGLSWFYPHSFPGAAKWAKSLTGYKSASSAG